VGEHDENITFTDMCARVGDELAAQLRDRSLAVYARGRDVAERAGIIVADTKFEFGTLSDGRLVIIDEVLTPDSSRFWPRESYAAGGGQPSLDKQPVRDFLDDLVAAGEWNKSAPPPALPPHVVDATSERYRALFRRLTGYTLDEFPTAAPGTEPKAR
jgi:phosphoribosylaminoimidazole-succinocarboxamide synthase